MTKRRVLLFTVLCLIIIVSSKIKIQTTSKELEELINSNKFKKLKEEQIQNNLRNSLFSSDDCLLPESEAKKILNRDYGIINDSPDKNLRFVLGKCNPVLLIPGIFSTKLTVQLNCYGLSQYEKDTTLKDLRVFCGDTLCEDETKTSEEHPLYISLSDKAFSILTDREDKYGSCLGFITNFFQNENECPSVNNKKICYHSDYIKVGFFGSSPNTVNDSKCGLEGAQNLLQTGISLIDEMVNENIPSAKIFKTMHETLNKKGYSDGFSLGAVPNDFRRYFVGNNFGNEVFRSQINRLYKNTGKPVVIVAHSYGNLLTLSNLVDKKNEDLLPKIKKFIAISPPFAGSTKVLDLFFHGESSFDISISYFGFGISTNLNIFSQFMMYNSIPSFKGIRPMPITSRLFEDSNYKELADAIRERMALENKCRNRDCSLSEIQSGSNKFDSIFKGYFPSLTESECAYESSIEGNKNTLNRKCYTEFYNVGDCPSVIIKTSSFNPSVNNVENYCNQTGPNFYYQKECNNEDNKQCLDEIFYTKGPYVYGNKEAVNYIINRYNNLYSSIYGKIDSSYFDTLDFIREGHKKLIDYQNKINIIKDLPPPPVDTDIVYGSFVKTIGALIWDGNDLTKKGEVYQKGGDETVSTWSSLLTGLKWIFDKKKKNLKQKYKLVEFCSRLSNGQYKLNSKKEQDFIALGCSCLDDNNVYKDEFSDCTHQSMISDDKIIDYVFSVINDPKETITVLNDKKIAVKDYSPNRDYLGLCNSELKNIFDTAK